MLHQLIPALAITVGPMLVLAPIVYALRPQGGRRWLSVRPVPARKLLARCEVDRELGLIPDDEWGDVSRPSHWTMPVAAPIPLLSTDRDMTGAFPVVAVAR